MTRAISRRTITETVQKSPDTDSFAGRLRAAIPDTGRLTITGYTEAFFRKLNEPDASLHVFKRLKASGQFTKKGEIKAGEVESADMESHLVNVFGVGTYQLRPEFRGRYYGPVSMAFRVGEEPEDDRGPAPVTSADDTQAVIDNTVKQLGQVAVVKKLKEATTGGEGMDMAGVAALIQAQQAPLLEMMRAAEARAQRAEDRVTALLDKMMDSRSQAAQTQVPLFAELLKGAIGKPEVLSVLLNGAPAPESNWLDTIRDVAREFAPMVQGLLAQAMQRPAATVAALPPGGGGPQPTGAGPAPSGPGEGDGSAMPMQLNEEQQMAKDMLVDFVVKGDFPNAYAVLESFPGFVPVGGSAMPLGEFIISRIDPAVNPKVYLPQLGTLIPDLKKTLPQAEAFIKHIQDRIVADDEAAKRAPASDPEPTRGGE